MKIVFLKHRFLSILILFVLSFSINGCSDDEAIKSFLEKQADTAWKFIDPTTGEILYVKINNSEINPFEIWFSVAELECFDNQDLDDDGTVEVIENSANELILKVVDDSNEAEHSIFTLTINGDTLTVKNERFEDDFLEDEEVFILLKTTDDLDGLQICLLRSN